ncbi:MAG: hypothetical protein PHD82_02515 [Candidatus Riflebacteria bacterium]|nr:hypothetical protein [Candidatus Riflebacteria bacterium]
MKIFNLTLCLVFLITVSGCSIPGSSGNPPVEDDSVTIKGRLNVPQVASNGILAAIGEENSADGFARFLAGATCIVNGKSVSYSLSSTTRDLTVEKMPPADSYHLELRCSNLKLRAFAPWSGRNTNLPFGVSLRSTADWYLRDALASSANIAHDHLGEYAIKEFLLDSLAGAMQTELKKTALTSATYDKFVSNGAAAAVNGKTLSECLRKNGAAFAYNGTFSGNVSYYAFNSSGKAVLAVQAVASMTCSQAGNSVSGSLNIEPTAVVPLVANPGIQSPSKTAFAFSGTVQNSFLAFTRKGLLGPLAGKALDSWTIFPVRGGVAVRAENLDSAYYTGLLIRPGEFILQKR